MKLYNLLGTLSKRAISRKKRNGKPYNYKPRADLIDRLSEATGMTRTEVYNQLLKEHEEIIASQPD